MPPRAPPGASYADLRLGETRRQFIRAKEDRLDDFSESSAPGFGLRVLVDGCWGFYGACMLDAATLALAVSAPSLRRGPWRRSRRGEL